jgi:hypothetical protein
MTINFAGRLKEGSFSELTGKYLQALRTKFNLHRERSKLRLENKGVLKAKRQKE